MSSPSNHFEHDSTAQKRVERRPVGSPPQPNLPSSFPPYFHPTASTSRGNLTGRIIPDSEPATSQESYGQLSPNHLEFTAGPGNHFSPGDDVDMRRASDLSDRTLYDRTEEEMQQSLNRVSFSSYQHPNDIPPPRVCTSPLPRARVRDVATVTVHLRRVATAFMVRTTHRQATSGVTHLGTTITGATHDPADSERNVKEQMDLRYMSYKQRHKEAQKIKIRFFVTSLLNRQHFIMKLARALMTFGAPSHRIESQLVVARILEVDVVHDELSAVRTTSITRYGAKKAGDSLDALLNSEPIYGIWTHCAINFWLSALICPLAFGGSLVAHSGCEEQALRASCTQAYSSKHLVPIALPPEDFRYLLFTGAFYRTSIAIFISFLARALSVGIQPGTDTLGVRQTKARTDIR
ncbi:hypothetical protein EDB92DRAFT_2105994 [Lactarius akahatsu]|uniref:Uncharacterized protein n=1 Tax=Lactarius akahatsu TaxID=416441 RepID=A0AAD4L8B3_9AGAM|nr:hypothetical protein EDB92DRAFT_2105994 [Lactarius akahatsu]